MSRERYEDLLAGILFLVIAFLIFIQLPGIKITQIAMDSRVMPRICMVLLLLFGILLIAKWTVRSIVAKKKDKVIAKELATARYLKPVSRVVACSVIYALFIAMLKPFGFIISGIIYLFLTFLVIVPDAWKRKPFYVTTLAVPVAIYLLFTRAFSLILPTGTIF